MFKNLVNFRDLGNIRTIDGKKLKEKKLLRSGELVRLADEDVRLLSEKYNLMKIIDFRSEEEVMEDPDMNFSNAKYVHIDLFGENKEQVSSMGNFMSIKTLDGIHELMRNIYKVLISSDGSKKGYRQFLDECLSLKDGSLLFHCYAGKDRTGVAGLLILTLLGVSVDDIYTDYLLTNELRKDANKILIENSNMNEEGKKIYEVALTVDKSYLDYIIEYTTNISGSFLDYIKRELTITDDEIKTLKDIFLEE